MCHLCVFEQYIKLDCYFCFSEPEIGLCRKNSHCIESAVLDDSYLNCATDMFNNISRLQLICCAKLQIGAGPSIRSSARSVVEVAPRS